MNKTYSKNKWTIILIAITLFIAIITGASKGTRYNTCPECGQIPKE